jgi:hypothetical protein
MKPPMGLTSTHFISYHDIKVENADLIEDAFGFNRDFHDVIGFLHKVRFEPGEGITKRLIKKIKDYDR